MDINTLSVSVNLGNKLVANLQKFIQIYSYIYYDYSMSKKLYPKCCPTSVQTLNSGILTSIIAKLHNAIAIGSTNVSATVKFVNQRNPSVVNS